MSFRLRIPKREENLLELVPLDVALELERHLTEVAQSAEEAGAGVCNEVALQRYSVRGFSVAYTVDRATQSVVVLSLTRGATTAG